MNYDEILNKGIPEHIALILDGNGRWAKKRGLPRTMGHRNGAYNLEKIAVICNEIGVKSLTVYAFSTENWNRPKAEVDYLMSAPVKYFTKQRKKVANSSIKIRFIGRKDRIPEATLKTFTEIEALTSDHQGLVLNIAFDYGGRNEIVTVTKQIAELYASKKITSDEINEQLFDSFTFTANQHPLDLLIRTSGEERISNYLLWQLAYAELYFTPCLWPDFDKEELFKAIQSYQNRRRRFGGLEKEETK